MLTQEEKERIKRLAQKGLNYKDIADELELKYTQVKYFCKRYIEGIPQRYIPQRSKRMEQGFERESKRSRLDGMKEESASLTSSQGTEDQAYWEKEDERLAQLLIQVPPKNEPFPLLGLPGPVICRIFVLSGNIRLKETSKGMNSLLSQPVTMEQFIHDNMLHGKDMSSPFLSPRELSDGLAAFAALGYFDRFMSLFEQLQHPFDIQDSLPPDHQHSFEQLFRIEGAKALYVAARYHRMQLIQFLMQLEPSSLFLSLALVGAAQGGHLDLCDSFLHRGASILQFKRKDKSVYDAIMAAAEAQHPEVLEFLFKLKGRDIPLASKTNALKRAASHRRKENAQFLISKGAEYDLILRHALEERDLDKIKFLSAAGADLSTFSDDRSLYSAVQRGHLEIFQFFISHGTNVSLDTLELAFQMGYRRQNMQFITALLHEFMDKKRIVKRAIDVLSFL